MSEQVPTVTRAEFIRRLIADGLTYSQSATAYESVVRTLEDGICAGARVTFGRVGALNPVKLRSRPVSMGFDRRNGRLKKVRRIFWMGARLKHKWVLFEKFKATHELNWKI